MLLSSIFVGLKLSLSVSFSLKPASIASAVCHPCQIIVLYKLISLFRCIKSRLQSLIYENKDTACMVNMVAVSGIFPIGTFDVSISSFH